MRGNTAITRQGLPTEADGPELTKVSFSSFFFFFFSFSWQTHSARPGQQSSTLGGLSIVGDKKVFLDLLKVPKFPK